MGWLGWYWWLGKSSEYLKSIQHQYATPQTQQEELSGEI